MRCTLMGMVLCAVPLPLASQAPAPPSPEPAPLFASHEPLEMRLEIDLARLKRDREEENPEREGRAVIPGGRGGGDSLVVSVDVRTRGNFRLRSNACGFPPLRLDFPRGQLDGSVLEGQNRLKLVTHCRESESHQDNVLEEYLAYRLYGLVTADGFQVRLARVTYVDTGGEDEPLVRWAFVIEAEEDLAERLGGEILEVAELDPARVRSSRAAPLTLFQYLIGNTDYSIYGVHNVVLVQTPDEVVPVPFDFDWSGLVDAPYARPDPRLGTRNVRERVYRGLCRRDVDHQALMARFAEMRPAMEGLVREVPGLSEDGRRDVLEYLEDFWEVIRQPDRARREIVEACLG